MNTFRSPVRPSAAIDAGAVQHDRSILVAEYAPNQAAGELPEFVMQSMHRFAEIR
jgi:hypothetical protein